MKITYFSIDKYIYSSISQQVPFPRNLVKDTADLVSVFLRLSMQYGIHKPGVIYSHYIGTIEGHWLYRISQ